MKETEKKDFYNLLNEENKELFDKIEKHEILGASNHLEIIGNMFIDIAENSQKNNLSLNESRKNLKQLADYYNSTRGNASRAVYNGILTMLKGLQDEKIKDNADLLGKIIHNVEEYSSLNTRNLERILSYAKNELISFNKILLFDYSSTVEKTIIRIAENSSNNIELYISESSAIDGGRPYFGLNHYDNVNITFFPDAALYYFLEKSDACLMGAETFYPDGTGFNTVGSDMVGVLCSSLDIPLYFITPLNKVDIRRLKGQRKEIVNVDYKTKYKNNDEIPSGFNTTIPELIGVKPQHIYAYICEEGVIPSNQMFQISLAYDKNLRGVTNG